MKPLTPLLRAAVATAALLLPPTETAACSIAALTRFTVDPSISDKMPPDAIEAEVTKLKRGEATGSRMRCSHWGMVHFQLTPPPGEDPREMGYRLELAAGELPNGLSLPQGPVAPFAGGWLFLKWADGICAEQEPIAFRLRIISVDRAGNEGPPFELPITAPGRSPVAGCREASGTTLLLAR